MTAPPEPGRGGPLPAFAMFSVLPVPSSFRVPGSRVVVWLPLVGVVIGALAWLPALAFWHGHSDGHGSPLLAATVIVTGLALLTRGLHLDGAADLADGLGGGRTAEQSLAIMRRSDIGPFGVIALVLLIILQITALSAILAPSSLAPAVLSALIAMTTGRVAVVLAARTGIRPASNSAFGVLVAGSVRRREQWLSILALVFLAVLARLGTGATGTQLAWTVGAVAAGLVAAELVCRHAVARLHGISGDVFGALVEVATTMALLVFAAESTWAH